MALDPALVTVYFRRFDEAVYKWIIQNGSFRRKDSAAQIGGDNVLVELTKVIFKSPFCTPSEIDDDVCIFAMAEYQSSKYRVAVFRKNDVGIKPTSVWHSSVLCDARKYNCYRTVSYLSDPGHI